MIFKITYESIHTYDSENDATGVENDFVSGGPINDPHMALIKAIILHLDFRKPVAKTVG